MPWPCGARLPGGADQDAQADASAGTGPEVTHARRRSTPLECDPGAKGASAPATALRRGGEGTGVTDQTSRLKPVRPHAAHPAIESRRLLHKTTTHKEVIDRGQVQPCDLYGLAPQRPYAHTRMQQRFWGRLSPSQAMTLH